MLPVLTVCEEEFKYEVFCEYEIIFNEKLFSYAIGKSKKCKRKNDYSRLLSIARINAETAEKALQRFKDMNQEEQ